MLFEHLSFDRTERIFRYEVLYITYNVTYVLLYNPFCTCIALHMDAPLTARLRSVNCVLVSILSWGLLGLSQH